MKLKSIVARRTGKILVKFNDEARGYYEDFAYLRQSTLSLSPPWLQGKKVLIGCNPMHVYHDTTYGIRAVNCNPRGSYYIKGDENGQDIQQSYITGEMAEDFITRALCSPENQSELRQLLIYVGIGVIATILVSAFAGYMGYQNFDILEKGVECSVKVIQNSTGVL
jgi:hypothetical protein